MSLVTGFNMGSVSVSSTGQITSGYEYVTPVVPTDTKQALLDAGYSLTDINQQYQIAELIKAVRSLEEELDQARLWIKNSAPRIQATQQSITGIQGQFNDVWTKFGEIDNSVAQLWSANKTVNDWLTEVNTRLSSQVTELGSSVSQTSNGNFFTGLLGGAGAGSLIALGIVALILMRK